MSTAPFTPATFYVTGGTMRPDAPSYIEREADQELYRLVKEGEYCYVLTPRQMGKSSLMARTAARLRKEGIGAAIVDISDIRGTEGAEPFYRTVAQRVHDQLDLGFDVGDWWKEREGLTALSRLTDYFAEAASRSSRPVVIFFDEIDSTPRGFSDDFFAGVRALYNRRATDPRLHRLTFVLLGVASPAQLIRDAKRTPFNIGRGIELADFTLDQARERLGPLLSPETIERVMYWTDGHPYLTQILCRASQGRDVDEAAEELLLSPKAQREEVNLKTTGERLKQAGQGLLRLYRRVLAGEKIEDQPANPLFAELKLTGAVKVDATGRLRVRNRVYEQVFSQDWVKLLLKRPRWQSAAVASLVIGALGVGAWSWKVQRDADRLAAAALDRIAVQALLSRDYDEALLTSVEAAHREDTVQRRRQIASLMYPSNFVMSARVRGTVRAAAFSPDGSAILLGSSDKTATLWSAETGRPLGVPLRHEDEVSAVSFSPDGGTILTGSGTIARLWRASTGEPTGSAFQHDQPVLGLAFDSDGKTILTATKTTVRRWSIELGRLVGQPFSHRLPDEFEGGVAFGPDGKTFLSKTGPKRVAVWHTDTGQRFGAPIQSESEVQAAVFSSGEIVATADLYCTVRTWRADTGQPLGTLFRHRRARTFLIDGPIAVSRDGKTVLVAGLDRSDMAQLWRVSPEEPAGAPFPIEGVTTTITIGPGGKLILEKSFDGSVRLYDTRKAGRMAAPLTHDQARVSSVEYPVYDSRVFSVTSRLDGPRASREHYRSLLNQEGGITAFASSPDGKAILSSAEEAAQLWRTDTGDPICTVPSKGISSAAVSPDGRTFIIRDLDGTKLWSADGCRSIGRPLTLRHTARSLGFSPDGKSFVVSLGRFDLYAFGFDGTSAELRSYRRTPFPVRTVRFPSDCSDCYEAIMSDEQNRYVAQRFKFDLSDVPPIQGDLRQLKTEWERKLGLRMTPDGKFEPLYPLPKQ